MNKILVGCDPEVFVKKDGCFVSAHGMIKGDKKNPFPVAHGAVQVDGMALEFNIDPAETENQFLINVQEVYKTLQEMVPGYQLEAVPVANFGEEYMKLQPAAALELGCDPDYNAWTGLPNPRPNGNRPFRTASGHVHIGWTNDQSPDDPAHISRCCHAATQMDFFLGLPSLSYDKDVQRRELYGKGGAMRVKKYGVEYRTLSNAWLNSSSLIKWVFRNTVTGMERLIKEGPLSQKYGDIQEIINTSDWKEAEKIIKAEKIALPVGV